jgi:DnaJ family protein A protein 2
VFFLRYRIPTHDFSRALRLHPDKGGDPDMFKEVTHAYALFICLYAVHVLIIPIYFRYEVLSDPEKRSIYDARGEAGLSEAGGMGGMDPQVRLPCHVDSR